MINGPLFYTPISTTLTDAILRGLPLTLRIALMSYCRETDACGIRGCATVSGTPP